MASEHDIANSEHRSLGERPGELPIGTKRTSPPELDTIILEDGDYTYIAQAFPGTLEADPGWAVRRIDYSVANTTKITWAGTGNFDQIATDLPALFS